MALHRLAARRDDNEADIVDALRKAGANVRRLSGAGSDAGSGRYKGTTQHKYR